MLLAIDVGNTETKLGCFEGEALAHTWRLTTEPRRTPDECSALFVQLFGQSGIIAKDITSIVIASVVPKLDASLGIACEQSFGVAPIFFEAHRQTLMPIRTERPEEVGADLVAMAIGGRARYGSPLIVVSYGTATVFMAISAAGEYCGVAIAPGIQVSIDALVGRTAKIPQIALEAPHTALGRNTIEALQAGIVYGFVGQSEALIKQIREEMGVDARVIATGGLAEIVARRSKLIERVDPHLSLEGLRLYHASRLVS
ncbi:MAG TPA: type III pantothenate kinase [Candidatus Tyrphobacter sp.]